MRHFLLSKKWGSLKMGGVEIFSWTTPRVLAGRLREKTDKIRSTNHIRNARFVQPYEIAHDRLYANWLPCKVGYIQRCTNQSIGECTRIPPVIISRMNLICLKRVGSSKVCIQEEEESSKVSNKKLLLTVSSFYLARFFDTQNNKLKNTHT